MTILVIGALLIGVAAGVLSGLLGVGGGIVIVPLMALALGQDQHVAQGVSLAVIVPTALVGAVTNWRKGNVDARMAVLFAIGAVVGSVAGATVATQLSGPVLRRLFAVALVLLGYRVLPASLRQDIRKRVQRLVPVGGAGS